MTGKMLKGWVVAFAAVIGLAACGDSGDTGGVKIDSGTEKALESDSPAEAMKAIQSGLSDNKPEVLWAAMPDSYRKDVTGLVHDFAAKMDPEMFSQATGLLKRAANALDDKKQYILGWPMLGMMAQQAGAGGDKKAMEDGITGVIGLLKTVTESDAMDHAKLKELDVGNFIQNTGGSIMRQVDELMKLSPQNPLKSLKSATFEEVSRDGDTATVKMKVEGEEDKTDKLKRVEGRWVPADMADEWAQTMADARKQIAEMDASKMSAADKQQWDQGLQMAEGIISGLEGVKSQSDFNQLVGKMMGQLMGGLGGMPGRGR